MRFIQAKVEESLDSNYIENESVEDALPKTHLLMDYLNEIRQLLSNITKKLKKTKIQNFHGK